MRIFYLRKMRKQHIFDDFRESALSRSISAGLRRTEVGTVRVENVTTGEFALFGVWGYPLTVIVKMAIKMQMLQFDTVIPNMVAFP